MQDTKENTSANDYIMVDLVEGQKNEKKFYKGIIIFLICVIFVQGLYHNYKWSEFDTVVLDSGDGGNANYIGNDGDIINGESSSTQEKTEHQQSETKAD